MPYDFSDFDGALDSPLSRLYRFCPRCWLPTAPMRRYTCPPARLDPPPAEALPALRRLADAIADGRYADDTAPTTLRERRWLGWLAWLVAYGRVGGATDGEPG